MHSMMMTWVIDRLKEPSTYSGLAVILAADFNLHFTPDFQSAAVGVLVNLAGLASIVVAERGHVISPMSTRLKQ
jgi:hypothetical protein